jgi:cell division protein ZapA (FtsZ GTPase activity inhibitor)
MAQVTVTIDGKAYRMACEEGQEDHLTDLATRFDRYVGHLKDQFGEIGDLRITVMAGIMIMDEISELTRRVASLEGELDQPAQQPRHGAGGNEPDGREHCGGDRRGQRPAAGDYRQAERPDPGAAELIGFN